MTDNNHQGNTAAAERLMTPREVADAFRVNVKTLARWALAGKIYSTKTPGGHRRFRESDVRALLNGGQS